MVLIFKVGHYNPVMVSSVQILGVPRFSASLHGLARLAALAIVFMLITGCGQKGPLFIATPPTAPVATAVNPPSATTAPAPAASAAR
jgi:predicted small lipoprotein YifL